MINRYFSTIREKLADELLQPPTAIECREPDLIRNRRAEPPPLSEITGSQRSERKKVGLLKINKSTVPHHIPPKLIKLAGTAVIPTLVALFRFSIERGLIFSSWKTARLAPIYKKDDETNIGNYRPVSLLSVPGTLARLWSCRLTHSRTTHIFNLASDKQLAYRVRYSTELLLINLTDSWRRAVDSGMAVATVFIASKKKHLT